MTKPKFPYQRVREYVLDQIRAGTWKPGEHLPSEVALAAQLDVHRLTVNRVMCELVRDGMLRRRRGIGTVVAEADPSAARTPFGEGLIGLITGHHFDAAKNPYYSEIFHGLQKTLQGAGMYLMPLGDVGEFLESLSTAEGRKVVGSLSAIVLLGPVDAPTYIVLEALHRPVVVVGVTEYSGPLCSVGSDDREGAAEMARKILAAGHRQIVHLNAAPPRRMQSKLEGFLEACEAGGAPLPYRYVVEARGLEIVDGKEAMEEFLARGLPFTAVFGAADNLALGALAALKEAGKNVPQDVSVAGYDGIATHLPGLPELTTMAVPRLEMGTKAGEQLAAMCKGQPFEQRIRLAATWFPGGTLGQTAAS